MTGPGGASEIRSFFDRAVSIAAAMREAKEDFAELKLEDKAGRIDWGRLRALAVAYDADQNDEKKHDRVEKLIEKAGYATWYAEILKLGAEDEQKVEPHSSSRERPAPQKSPPVSVPRGATKEAKLASGEPVRAYSAPSTPSRPPDEQIKAGPHTANGAGSPLSGEPESEPAVLLASALGQRESAGDTALSAGSPLPSEIPLDALIPVFCRRDPNDPVWSKLQ